MAKNRYALVLSGGGFKGAFQYGALKYIKGFGIPHADGTVDLDVKFDIVAGVSVGALNGALIAMDRFDLLEMFWDDVSKKGHAEIYTSDILTVNDNPNGTEIKPDFGAVLKKLIPGSIFGKIIEAIFDSESVIDEVGANFKKIKGLADNTPMLNKLKNVVSKNNFPQGVTYRCGLVSLTDGEYHSLGPEDFSTDLDLQLAIVASTAIPIVWPPVPKIKTTTKGTLKNLVDGGVRNNSPLGDVIDLIKQKEQPDDVWHIVVINCNSVQLDTADIEYGVADVALRAANDLMPNEIFRSDMSEFLRINELVNQVEKAKLLGTIPNTFSLQSGGHNLKSYNIKVIEPTNIQDVGSTLDSSRKAIRKRFDAGFRKADAVFKAIPTDEQPWT